MKAKEIRELGRSEIEQRIADEQQELRQLHFQHAIADIPNPMIIRQKRRFIARLHSILGEIKAKEAEL